MDFYQVINSRESIRSYDSSKKVSSEKLTRILEAGIIAPSAVNIQPWRFILVSSPEMLERVRACYHRDWFKEAPHILIVKGDKSAAWVRNSDGYNSIETDLAIAMDHIILAAESESVATCWIAAFNYKLLRETLELTDDEVIFAITPLGYPKDDFKKKGSHKRKPLQEVVQYL